MISWRLIACALLASPRATRAQTPMSSAAQLSPASAGVLAQIIGLRLEHVTLEAALTTIGARADIRIAYSRADVPLDRVVSLDADSISVGDALKLLLRGTGVAVQELPGGHVTLWRATPTHDEQAVATIAGLVHDSLTGAGIAFGVVRVEETGQAVQTGRDGRYALAGIAPGEYHVTARRVGYSPKTRTVTAVDGQVVTLDFALSQPPTKLDEVVTTAVGDQRRYQIGNDIASINVDSLAPTTPVVSLTDLISARAPGVEVLESNGEVGSGPALRIRGQGSLVVQGDPIVIVDGVRQDNTPGGAAAPASLNLGGSGTSVPAPSRLNDIDYTDVESIDILKGPSAATEYGTDAANGVIVIKTKHSQAGSPRWSLSAEHATTEVGTPFPETYYAYGHTTGGAPTPVQCPLVPLAFNTGVGSTAGTCAVDSVVKFNALDNSRTSMFGTGDRERLDLSIAGGSQAVRYYAAGGLTNETGTMQMPPALAPLADSVGLPKSLWRPNTETQRSARANTVIALTSNAEVQINAAYLATGQQAPSQPSAYLGAYFQAPINNAMDNYGYSNQANRTPVYTYGNTVGQNTNRLTGSVAANWLPASWFTAHATAGVDHGSQRFTAEILPQVAPFDPTTPTTLGISNGTTDIYSVDARAAATARISANLRSITSGGLQLVDTRSQSVFAQSNSITATNPTLNGSTAPITTQSSIRQATLGGYLEEQLGLWDRLFVTGALRIDAGSNFGSSYSSAAYPKGSVSWLALTGGATTIRLRGAFGESGVQPPNGAALQLYGPQAAYLNGVPTTVPDVVNIVNPHLEPERSTEFEGGADLGMARDRVTIGFTAYAKRTTNALVPTGVGWEAGGYNAYENIGEVTNNGVEANVSATLVRSRRTTWEVSLAASTNHNDLVKLAPGLHSQTFQGLLYLQQRFAPGTPLYGYAAETAHWTDRNHDGIVELDEVSVDDSLSYAGPSQPTRMASLSTHLGLWRGFLTLGALADYRGGFRLANGTAFQSVIVAQADRASNDAHAPIWQQLRDVAANLVYTGGLDNYAPPSGFYEDASYVRFRELSVTLALPERFARAAHVRTLSLTGAVRNLWLWTPYTGGDPEVTASYGGGTVFQPTTNAVFTNRDIRQGLMAVPLSRYVVLRLNAGF